MKAKRLLALFLSAAILAQGGAALAAEPTGASAVKSVVSIRNNAQTAETINLNERKSYTFREYWKDTGDDEILVDDTDHYYRFVPSTTGYYEITVDNFIPEKTTIDVVDSSGRDVDYGYWNQYTNTCKAFPKLTAGKTYYIVVELYPPEGRTGRTAYTTITKHTHTLEKDIEPAEVVSTGMGEYIAYDGWYSEECTTCGYYSDKEIPYVNDIRVESFVYDGKNKKTTVSVKDYRKKTVSSKNYTYSCPSNCKNVGRYKITIQFKNLYTGSVKSYFEIVPQATKLTSVSASSRGFTARWKKQPTQTTGYQLQYASNSKFKSAKTITFVSNKTTSRKVTKLSAKKKYYVRIRTYKTVSGKRYYSIWSAAKSVVTGK